MAAFLSSKNVAFWLLMSMGYTITALSVQKRNPQRVNVYLDGEFAFGLARIVAAWLNVGQILDDEKIARLKAEDELESAYGRALRLISYRPRTESEIRRSLSRAEIPTPVLDAVIERLKNAGLVNDAGFARSWVDNRTALRPRGRRALSYELRQRGVDADIIEGSLVQVDDSALAYEAAGRRAARFANLDWNTFRQKMFRFLAQRGFDYEASSDAIRRVWQELHLADQPSEEEDIE